MQGRGIGWHLMQALFKYAQNEGVKEVSGIVHVENKNMLDMAHQLGCASRNVEGDAALREVVWRSGEIERKDIERKQTINTARAASTSRST
jgi:acetyltransferase